MLPGPHDVIYVKTNHMHGFCSLLKNLLTVLKPLTGDYQKFFTYEAAMGMQNVVSHVCWDPETLFDGLYSLPCIENLEDEDLGSSDAEDH